MMKVQEILSLFDKYDPKTKTYEHCRGAGLFSILNWSLRIVTLLEMNGYKVDKIKLLLDEYMDKTDCYDKLFFTTDNELSLNSLPSVEKENFYTKTNWTHTGFFENPKEVNFQITNQVISKFFNPTQEVIDWYNIFLNYLGVDNSKIIFLWARKTDKTSETTIPEVETYLKFLSRVDKKGKKILVQTDDYDVLQEFKNSKIPFQTLPHISLPKIKKAPFHINVRDISESDFQKYYGVSKLDHLRQMVALTLLAQKSHITILYPGNPSTFLPLFSGTFQHFLLFKNGLNLFE